jgi:hypothetical protein
MMCEAPKTESQAAVRYWSAHGIGQMAMLTEYMQTQKALVEDAFIAGAVWGLGHERARWEEKERLNGVPEFV